MSITIAPTGAITAADKAQICTSRVPLVTINATIESKDSAKNKTNCLCCDIEINICPTYTNNAILPIIVKTTNKGFCVYAG